MSLINKIFRQKHPQPAEPLFRTDIHAHFLPGLDDGSRTMEESLELIGSMYSLGYRQLVCTPHIQAEFYRNTPAGITVVFDNLQQETMQRWPDLQLFKAAEYLLDDGFGDLLKTGLLSFGKKQYVLVELSYFTPYPTYKNYLQDMQSKGYQPIMAHPERYTYWMNHDAPLQELKAAGIFLQVNLPSLSGMYGPEIRKRAMDLLSKGLIDFAASDVHNQRYFKMLEHAVSDKRLRTILMDAANLNREFML